MRKLIAIILLAAWSGAWGGQWTHERGDSVYAAYLRDIPAVQQQEPYWITCIIRYDDIAYQKFTVQVRWHYLVAGTGKYRIIPVDGRPFAVDNIEPIIKGVTQ
jgi:hypothetical protein